MRQNYYLVIFADDEKAGALVIRAKNLSEAQDVAHEGFETFVDVDRFPDVKWPLVITETPTPTWIKTIQELQEHAARALVLVLERSQRSEAQQFSRN